VFVVGEDSGDSSGLTRSAVSGGRVAITNSAAQEKLTRENAEQTVAHLDRDVNGAHTAAQRQDVSAMERSADATAAIKNETLAATLNLTDQAYWRIFFLESPDGVLERNEDGSTKYNENGKPAYRALTAEEQNNLVASPDGKVHVTNNGIFNDVDAAAKYAAQHSSANGGPQYFAFFKKSDNPIVELIIAGYQLFLEGSILGLSISSQEDIRLMEKYGVSGLHLDAHSRGALTVGNAMEAIRQQQNAEGLLSGTTINFFGPAYNARKADENLGYLQNRNAIEDPAQRDSMMLHYENHFADLVGTLVGGNPGTGGTIPEKSNSLWETIRAVTGQSNTVHNCYGDYASAACAIFWEDYPHALPKLQPAINK
jgi:filamentous hemagglutinin